ncbi:MAG TPA: acetyltransferase [Caulobacteraceae bacterium]|jgi:UDP-perosamine 4-acetyltransferase
MDLEPVVILGAGGHAKVVIELLRAQGRAIAGLTDADSAPRSVLGVPVVGDDTALAGLRDRGVRHAFVAIGDNAARQAAGARATDLGFILVNAVSPTASVSASARLGHGVAVMAGAVINADAVIGDLAIVNSGAIVDHDCHLERCCHVGPGAVLAGGVRLGAGALIGVGASVTPGCSIGARTIVGAGACVVADLGADVTAIGVPARPVAPAAGGRS